ncbi:hypothetical protein AgCh_029619 [Apium graveolens]
MGASILGIQATVGWLKAKSLTTSSNPFYQGAEDTLSGCFTRVSTGLAEECSEDPLTLALIIPMIDGDCREADEEYIKYFHSVEERLLSYLSKWIGLEENELRTAADGDNIVYLLKNSYYPSCPRPDLALGVPAYAHMSAVTILVPNDRTEMHNRLKEASPETSKILHCVLSNELVIKFDRLFRECPRPDDKQRMKLSQDLGLKPRQVKFCFQNRRTEMKAQQDRADNSVNIVIYCRYQLGRQPANTRLSSNKTVRRVRVRGGNVKWRTLRKSVEYDRAIANAGALEIACCWVVAERHIKTNLEADWDSFFEEFIKVKQLIEAGLREPEPFDGSCPSFLPPSAPDS